MRKGVKIEKDGTDFVIRLNEKTAKVLAVYMESSFDWFGNCDFADVGLTKAEFKRADNAYEAIHLALSAE